MKPSAPQWPGRISAHAAFYSYRWLAWAIAALALTMPGRPVETLPRDAGILLLAGVINVVATALSHNYVRLVQAQPRMLIFDLMGCVALLWLSGSAMLPFLPYALSSLVLPALLFGWPGALVVTLAFLFLDLLGLNLINSATSAELSGLDLFARVLTPLAFALVWVSIERMFMGTGQPPEPQAAPPVVPPHPPQAEAPPSMPLPEAQSSGLSERQRMRAALFPPLPPRNPLPLVITRALEQHANPARRLLFDLKPIPDGSILPTIEQLGAAFAQQSDFTVRVTSSGHPQPLAAAQQTLMLHTAQEALRNVQQHAQARTVLIDVGYAAETVTLTIHDDGVGLPNGSYERSGMHALRALRYRIAEFDGEFFVLEGERGGLTVRAVVPYV
ncbi:sensor histidine kinase [Candidatus Viridilinea mediisalina]|uniref:Histidine kinase/HSP90-like ATPase domain-containing protein n=1 Tax=Candidatus Viridilinea mediisalina TaxID=2024553 RepID=A0A2A6RKK5_9CHLR|nr:hypothetical protein [Candidatus Viridilinea mediisalina]PDW03419.1 hypothetical protein CJ255_08805 [Candidatus Viridilinea mediisalina]